MDKNKLKLVVISILIIAFIDYLYLSIIVEKFNGNVAAFGKHGYPHGEFSFVKYVYATFIIYLLSFVLPMKINSPSSLVISVYYYIAVVPYFAFFTINLSANENVMYIDFLNIFIFFAITKYFFSKNTKVNKNYNKNRKIEKKIELSAYVIIFISLVILLYLYLSFGTKSSITLDNILDVYGQRESFNENAGFIGSILSAYVIYGAIPFLIFLYKKNNNYVYIIISLMLGFFTFLTTGSKLFFGSTLLTVFLMLRFVNGFSSIYIGLFTFILILISYLQVYLYESYILISLFVRRMLIIPAQLFGLFHEYVNEHELNYLAMYTSSITGHKKISISHEIGDAYYRIGSSANNGIISDAYANFGVIGVVLYSLFFVLIFKSINKLNKKNHFLITPLFVGLAISLTNSGLLAVLVYQISMILLVFGIYNTMKRIKT